MPSGLPLIVAILASYRLTRLVNEDSILDRPRSWFYGHAPAFLAEMVACPFCVGFWISGLVVLSIDLYGIDVPFPVAAWLAVAGGSALVYEFRRVE